MDNNPFRKSQQQKAVMSSSDYTSPNLGNVTPQYSSDTGYSSFNPSQTNPLSQQPQYQQNALNTVQHQPLTYNSNNPLQQQPLTTGVYSQPQQPYSGSLPPSSALSPQQGGFNLPSSFSQPPSSFNSYSNTPQNTFNNSNLSAVPHSTGLSYASSNPAMMSPTNSFVMPSPQTNTNAMYNSNSLLPQQNQPFHFMPQLGMTGNPSNGMYQPQQQQRHPPVDASSLLKADTIRKVECPVCNKMLEGDDIAINHHVNEHYTS